MDIRAVIKSIENGRISLSHKELLGTWEENANSFCAGETVAGIVRSVENYGAFVELAPNLAGLAESKDGVKAGQQASVYIKSIIPEKMKIKIIIIDTFDYKYNPQNLSITATTIISTDSYIPPRVAVNLWKRYLIEFITISQQTVSLAVCFA